MNGEKRIYKDFYKDKIINKSIYLERLRKLMHETMYKNSYTLEKMAEICDVSYGQICNILYGKSFDIKLSTFERICINNKIPYSDIFDIYSEAEKDIIFDKKLKELNIVIGSKKYCVIER